MQYPNAPTSSTYTANSLNQYTSITNTPAGGTPTITNYGYDSDGNLVSGGNTSYTYDEANRLTQLIRTNPNTGANEAKSEFVYDGLSRKRISREYSWINNAWVLQSETRRVYDGMNVVQERDDTNAVKISYTCSGNIGGLLARTVGE